MTGRKVGVVRRLAYRVSDFLDSRSRRAYAGWTAFGSLVFGLIIYLLIPVIPLDVIVVPSVITGWLVGWFTRDGE